MGNLCPYWDGRLPMSGVDTGVCGGSPGKGGQTFSLRWSRQSWRTFRTNLAANSFALRSNLAARSAGPAREVTRSITRPIRKEHFGLSTRRAPFSPHLIRAP